MTSLLRHPRFTLFFVLVLLTVWRVWARQAAGVDLFFDEAYYWGWAQTPDWGYYSKPPIVGWLIWLSTSLFGDYEWSIRLPSNLLYPATSLIIFSLCRQLFAANTQRDLIALAAAITYATLPVIGFGNWFMTTDAPLLFFWSLSLLFYTRAYTNNVWIDWLLLGLCLGAGMMSKYSTLFFIPCMGVHWLLCQSVWSQLRNPKLYVAAIVALLVLLPNLYWNYSHDFASYKHTAEISQLDRAKYDPSHMFEFIGAQFGLFGFILLPCLLIYAFRRSIIWRNSHYVLLASFTFTPLILFCGLAFTSRAFANWAAFSYVAGAVLIAALCIDRQQQRWLQAGILVNVLLLIGLCHWHQLAPRIGITLTAKTDPYVRISGWKELGEKLAEELKAHPDARLVGESRDMIAEMSFYAGRLSPNGRSPLIYNATGVISNHYALTADIKKAPAGEFIFITEQGHAEFLSQSFESAQYITQRRVDIYPNKTRAIHIWLVKNFQGYPHAPL